jgi:(1->4)-alpha-D-glucan 1-alpha-D-glucosylmutase
LFEAYSALDARGPHANHVFGFDRGGALTAVTRLPVRLEESGGWHPSDDVLVVPNGEFEDALTGRRFAGPVIVVAELFEDLPAALLVRPDGRAADDGDRAADRNDGDRT